MRGGTLFSGIGAPEVSAPWVDWRWSADIDDFANAVRAHHWPEVPNLGDVAAISDPEPVDLIVFGSPCQDNSVGAGVNTKGVRSGLAGDRSGLAYAGLRVVRDCQPRCFVFENVPGLLQTDEGWDFARLCAEVERAGYGWAYRIIEPASLGSDQARSRLFMVGHRLGCIAAGEILAFGESSVWHRKTEAATAPVLTARGAMAYDDRTPCILDGNRTRIATPLEWERAMGFPDHFTDIPWRGKRAPDGRRYKALGNSMAVPVVGWVLDRIRAFEAARSERMAAE